MAARESSSGPDRVHGPRAGCGATCDIWHGRISCPGGSRVRPRRNRKGGRVRQLHRDSRPAGSRKTRSSRRRLRIARYRRCRDPGRCSWTSDDGSASSGARWPAGPAGPSATGAAAAALLRGRRLGPAPSQRRGGIWRASGGHLEGIWRASGGHLEGIWTATTTATALGRGARSRRRATARRRGQSRRAATARAVTGSLCPLYLRATAAGGLGGAGLGLGPVPASPRARATATATRLRCSGDGAAQAGEPAPTLRATGPGGRRAARGAGRALRSTRGTATWRLGDGAPSPHLRAK